MRSNFKGLTFWLLVLVALAIMVRYVQVNQEANIEGFNYPQFIEAIKDNKVDPKSLVINDAEKTVSGKIKPEFASEFGGATEFEIVAPPDKVYDELRAIGEYPQYEKVEENGFFQAFLVHYLPILLMLILVLFIFRQIQVGGGKAMSFGKSRARMLTETKNKVTFKEVAGVDEAKEDLQEIVQFLKDPKKFTKLGGRIPKGVLLVGPPGTGKTLLARAVAGEAGVPFFTISGSDFVEMFVGVGASRVRDLFEQGKKNAPCIIFIDEIDAVGRHRGAGMGGGHDEREQTLNQLLVEMDGFESNEGVILIAATNRPDVLDPALLRPGRFDRRVIVNSPDILGREQILNVHAKKVPLASDVDLAKIARGTPGFSGADLANLVNEAALQAARRDRSRVTMEDFEAAKDKVMMGAERRSMVISEEDKRLTAYHEAGHAIVGKLLPKTDPVHKVTIIPRGMALGLTQFLPTEDRRNLTKLQAESLIATMFGGRAAEEIIFKDFTTGAGNDIERATEIARRMVCEWGMSEKLGPLAYEKREGPVFLGMQQNQVREYSEHKAEEIDKEVHRIVTEGHQKAKSILQDNIKALHTMAEALLEFETLEAEEVDAILAGKTVKELAERREEFRKKMTEEQEKGRKEFEEKEARERKAKEKGEDPIGGTDPVIA